MKGFRPYLRKHLWQWALGGLCTAGAVLANVLIPRILGWAVDDLRSGVTRGAGVPRDAAMIVLAAGLSSGFYVAMRRLNGNASRQVAYEIRRDIFARLTQLDASYFARTRTGDLMSRLTGDLGAVQDMLGFGLTQCANTLLILTFTLGMMLHMSWRLGLIVLGVFPLVIGMLALLLRVVARRYARVQEELARISTKAQENFSGIRVVKGYAIEDREAADYKALNDVYRRQVLRLARVEAPLWATVGLLMNGVFMIVLFMGARQLLHAGQDARLGGLTLGAFITFTTYLFQLNWPMLSVGVVANLVQRGTVSWGRLHELLQAQPAIRDGAQTDARITAVQGRVTFDHVTLELGGRVLLEDLSLEVPPGQTLGITGRTGAGKTLVTALVSRLIEPTSGRVLVDGHDVRTLPLEVLRHHLGVVPQEPFLFSDTLAENIGFGLESSTKEGANAKPDPALVQWAAEVAGLDGDVSVFPQRYDTMLGERGVTLSGGQRQRTALARAVARRPRILILDDAMSAVDTETESRILSELKNVLEGRTVFLIGHRVSTLRHADHIVVLEGGRIVEQGTHEALLALGGRYTELDRKQQLARALERQGPPVPANPEAA